MNILKKIASIPGMPAVKEGFLPARPDNLVALFQYDPEPPAHFFGGTDFVDGVQVRVRNKQPDEAKSIANSIAQLLNHHHDQEISVLQSTPVLDIGLDDNNPQRQEYTINFIVRRL